MYMYALRTKVPPPQRLRGSEPRGLPVPAALPPPRMPERAGVCPGVTERAGAL